MKGVVSAEGGKPVYRIDGKVVSKKEFYRTFTPAPEGTPAEVAAAMKGGKGWPKTSIVMGVHPKSVKAANERNIAAGVGVRYLEDGRAVVPDRNEQKKLLKLRKMHNNDGGYGD